MNKFLATTYVPLVSGLPSQIKGNSTGNLSAYLNTLIKFGIGLAGILAVIMIVYGGFQYVTTDAWSEKHEGKQRIQAAVGGLLLALCSFLILNTIDPHLTDLNFAPKIAPIKDLQHNGAQIVETDAAANSGGVGSNNGTGAVYGPEGPDGGGGANGAGATGVDKSGYPILDTSKVTYAEGPGGTIIAKTGAASDDIGIDFDGSRGAYKVQQVDPGTPGAIQIGDNYYKSVGYEDIMNAYNKGTWSGVANTGGANPQPIVNPDGTLTGLLNGKAYGTGDTEPFVVLTNQQKAIIEAQTGKSVYNAMPILVTNNATGKTVTAYYRDSGGTKGAGHTEIGPLTAQAVGIQYGKNSKGTAYAQGSLTFSLPPQ